MSRLNIKKIERIQNFRNFTPNTLRLDMAERGNSFPSSFYSNFIMTN